MKKVLVILLSLTLMFLLLTGCGKSGNDDSQVEEPPVDIHANDGRNPLTGEWVDKELSEGRPVAVMINNIIDAQPMSGIGAADIIIEAPVEYNISRCMAIFQDYSDLEKIGSVRSCRLHFPLAANEYDAIYVHFGASDIGYSFLYKGYVDHLDGMADGDVFYRTTDRYAPHNAYTSTEGILAGIERKNIETKLEEGFSNPLMFSEDDENEIELIAKPEPVEGEEETEEAEEAEEVVYTPGTVTEATRVETNFPHNKPYFIYNDTTKTYDRFQFDEAHIDVETGEQLTFKNLIVQECNWYMADSKHKKVITTGEGTGRYYTNGKCVNIKWSKDTDLGVTHYTYEDGSDLILNQGKTFISIEIQGW